MDFKARYTHDCALITYNILLLIKILYLGHGGDYNILLFFSFFFSSICATYMYMYAVDRYAPYLPNELMLAHSFYASTYNSCYAMYTCISRCSSPHPMMRLPTLRQRVTMSWTSSSASQASPLTSVKSRLPLKP